MPCIHTASKPQPFAHPRHVAAGNGDRSVQARPVIPVKRLTQVADADAADISAVAVRR